MKKLLILLACLLQTANIISQEQRYSAKGVVLSRATRAPIPYATVVVSGAEQYGASADSAGRFEIFGLRGDIYRFEAHSLGYQGALSQEYIISATSSPIEILMEESARAVDSVVVVKSVLSRVVQSPVSMRQIGLQMLERTAGANRDLSKVVQNFPGVAFSPASYRNDLIVRGGSPSENRFYVDGFELPNINHFSTQGASGGPVGLINADLVRQVDLYSGAFPITSEGSLSSVLGITLRDGDPKRQKFKATLGASEVAASGSGHLSERTTYIFSLRRSYLQLLFKALGLPFLPDYYDMQFKSRTRLSQSDEITTLVVGALDDMSLNDSAKGESAKYILSYLPRIKQNTLTAGVAYRHFEGRNSYSLRVSHSYLYNDFLKYRRNNDSAPEELTLKLNSTEQWTTMRSENRSYLGSWIIRYGARLAYNSYSTDSFTVGNLYRSSLGYWQYGIYGLGEYTDPDGRFSSSLGLRADGASYSHRTAQLWRFPSPRGALSVRLSSQWDASLSSGIYYQAPPFTALSYTQDGVRLGKGLKYMQVWSTAAGVEYHPTRSFKASVEGFYKDYNNLLLSVADGIPLWDKGADYGTVGNEALNQTVTGRAYGAEIMARWQIQGRLSAVGSVTLFRSEYRTEDKGDFRPSAWDNRFILNASCSYSLPRNWAVAAKVAAVGGAPYTPYDLSLAALVALADGGGAAQYDYTKYNTERLNPYCQLDLRVDKSYYLKRSSISIYLDLQNITRSVFTSPSIPTLTTGEQYEISYIKAESGVILPTVGVTIEF